VIIVIGRGSLENVFSSVVEEVVHHELKALKAEVRHLESKLDYLIMKGDQMSSVMDDVRSEVASIRGGVLSVQDAVTALAQRLTDNPTAAEATAVAEELHELAGALGATTASIDALDPDLPGGPIEPGTDVIPPEDATPV